MSKFKEKIKKLEQLINELPHSIKPKYKITNHNGHYFIVVKSPFTKMSIVYQIIDSSKENKIYLFNGGRRIVIHLKLDTPDKLLAKLLGFGYWNTIERFLERIHIPKNIFNVGIFKENLQKFIENELNLTVVDLLITEYDRYTIVGDNNAVEVFIGYLKNNEKSSTIKHITIIVDYDRPDILYGLRFVGVEKQKEIFEISSKITKYIKNYFILMKKKGIKFKQ